MPYFCLYAVACNHCLFCDQQLYSSCDNTNPSKEQELLYGAHTAGIYGYTHLTGGYPGGQAEYLRVPLADNNCIKVPDQIRDENVILISDVLATAWHANELGEVKKGDNVAIWGAGPVGILAAHCAFARGANRVVLLDLEAYRLDFAKQKIPRLETVDCSSKNRTENQDPWKWCC
jgi:threonine dehydrogenase-like Zn-dependent dehydrogenase